MTVVCPLSFLLAGFSRDRHENLDGPFRFREHNDDSRSGFTRSAGRTNHVSPPDGNVQKRRCVRGPGQDESAGRFRLGYHLDAWSTESSCRRATIIRMNNPDVTLDVHQISQSICERVNEKRLQLPWVCRTVYAGNRVRT